MKFNALAILSTILLAACSDAPESAGANAAPPIEAAAEINAPAGEYRIDPAHATVVFRILHMGLSHYTAGFSDFSATLNFDPAAPETMNVSAVINVRSLTIPNPPEGFHDTLLGPDWLKAADYPDITFTSTKVTRTGARAATVEGKLTLLGVTAPVTMEAEYVGGYPGFHPHDPQARIGLSAHGILNRADFGMTQYLPTNESPGALSNEIEFRIDAEFLGPPTPPEITEMDYNQQVRTMIAIHTVDWVPPFARGLLRDLRLRWALEEADHPYEMKFVPLGGRDAPDWRAKQPFGQIPVFEENGKTMFETGAILLHLAERSDKLAPGDADGKAEMTTWLFAALNSVEPQLQAIVMHDRFHRDKDWYQGAREGVAEIATKRLGDLASVLETRDFLAAGRFTVADIAMTTVLRIVMHTDLVTRDPRLAAYLKRCEGRPAFQKAFADQLADIDAHAPKS